MCRAIVLALPGHRPAEEQIESVFGVSDVARTSQRTPSKSRTCCPPAALRFMLSSVSQRNRQGTPVRAAELRLSGGNPFSWTNRPTSRCCCHGSATAMSRYATNCSDFLRRHARKAEGCEAGANAGHETSRGHQPSPRRRPTPASRLRSPLLSLSAATPTPQPPTESSSAKTRRPQPSSQAGREGSQSTAGRKQGRGSWNGSPAPTAQRWPRS